MPRTNKPRSKKPPTNTNNSSQPRSDVDEAPVGLFDFPPDDVRSREFVTGHREPRSTERNVQYQATRASGESTRQKSIDTRARNRSLESNKSRRRSSKSRHDNKNREGPDPSDTEAVSAASQRGRPRATRRLSLSASPEPTTNEHNQSTQASNNSQFTYEYETLTHEGLVQYAKEEFNLDVEGRSTHDILELLRLAEAEQAPQVGSTRRPPSIVMLPPTPLGVGGGWSQNIVSSKRRRSQVSTPSNDDDAGKPRRRVTVEEVEDVDAFKPQQQLSGRKLLEEVEEDTATESETDDEPAQTTDLSARLVAEHIVSACPGSSANIDVGPRPPQRGTHAPPPTRDNTPATVLDSEPSIPSSHSLGGSPPLHRDSGSQYGLSIPPDLARLLPVSFFRPLTGPTHARLRAEAMLRFLTDALRNSDTADAQAAGAGEVNPESDTSQRATRGSLSHPPQSPPLSRSETTSAQLDEVPETEFDTASDNSRPAKRDSPATRTYGGSRSHHPDSESLSRPDAPTVISTDANNDVEELPQPNSPSLTPSQLLRRERVRATGSRPAASSHRAAPCTQRPTTRRQSRRPLGGKGNAIGRAVGGTRRPDPASAARNDMLAFNRAVAQGEATSLVDSVARQSDRTARRSPPLSRPADELLEDDEEMIAQAEAYAKLTWPLRPSRIRKPKPLARDVSGIDRQILTMAKIHLFAYALVEGIYQTRSTFLRWASDVHEATSQVELPDRPYNKPKHEIYEIMVNSIATRRGKAKELLREFVARVSGFRQNMKKHEVIQCNIDIFNRLYPNNFHCKSFKPRQGDYEHPEIGHCIALVIFYGPNSVGVLYPEYFREMPLTAVAFCLAIWQFCLEEWASGWRQNGDLGAGAMREKYEAQLAGLKELRRIAPRRMSRLQNEWRDYVIDYSGALLDPAEQSTVDLAGPLQMRPDTPEQDDVMSVEELNDRLFETARQASIQDRMAEIAAEELAAPMDVEDSGSRDSTPHSRPSTPVPVEQNEYGVLTARSKGKNRAK
ncbi:unnamed protein product [Rhizoctonia solani]|uniref:DUF6532 domain-containing protein n=1 Tax=Rhizoctonia solani TaxID=456999 RepID=A0A8H3HZ25_9AGAM|nr:unnamed protein product [Rhizoctonia solani]